VEAALQRAAPVPEAARKRRRRKEALGAEGRGKGRERERRRETKRRPNGPRPKRHGRFDTWPSEGGPGPAVLIWYT